MAKQKFVVKLSLDDAKKRAKALKTAVTVDGVLSVALDDNKLVVIGDGTDAITLTTQLRKKLGYADLISVSSGGDEKKEKEKEKESKSKSKGETKNTQPAVVYPYQYSYPHPYAYYGGGAYDHHPKFYSIV